MQRDQIFKFQNSQILKYSNSCNFLFQDQNCYLNQQVNQWISCRIQASAIYLFLLDYLCELTLLL